MKDIRFCCQSCGRHLVVDEAGVGLQLACPECQQQITVPAESAQLRPRRSSLAGLDEQSILRRTKTGDTPLHRAARQGRIQEIPRELLSIEHFLATNNEGRTPLHFAATNAHLDQVPPEFLTEHSLSIRDMFGATALHRAAEYGSITQIPKAILTGKLMGLRNKSGETVSDILKDNLPTEKQLKYLKDLGVPFEQNSLTKSSASGLIERALHDKHSHEAPSEKELAKIERLGLASRLPGQPSRQDVLDVFDTAKTEPATERQFEMAAKLGLNLTHKSEFTMNGLDQFLKLADRRPSMEHSDSLSKLGFKNFEGTALHARLILALATLYDFNDSHGELEETDITSACKRAVRDPEFYHPTISGSPDCFLEPEIVTWPETKLNEWMQRATGS